MDIREILATIFQVVIIPLLTVLVGYAVKWINAKAEEIKASTDNAYAQKYIDMLRETIVTNVIAVNQTYVEALKDKDAFTLEAQQEAFVNIYYRPANMQICRQFNSERNKIEIVRGYSIEQPLFYVLFDYFSFVISFLFYWFIFL